MNFIELEKRGKYITESYDLMEVDVTNRNSNNCILIRDFEEIPVYLKLYEGVVLGCDHEFIIRISYTPIYKFFYIWPSDKQYFEKMFLNYTDAHSQFINILNYLKKYNKFNKHYISKKYGLK